MMEYRVYDYAEQMEYTIECDWSNPEITEQFLSEDSEAMKSLKIGESCTIADLGLPIAEVTRVK